MSKSPINNQISNITNRELSVAIVHDWLYGGGAEKVVLELHKLYPDAPIYTSYCSDEWRQILNGRVVTGYLQNWPFNKLRKFLPALRQRWFRRLDLSSFDVVISSSGNGEAKFVLPKKQAGGPIHISYCHTPTHFYWRHYDQYLENPGFRPRWLIRLGLRLLVRPLKKQDYIAAQKIDYFIANSTHIQRDIKKFYGRDSVVIFPPVNTARFEKYTSPKYRNNQQAKRHGFVTLGRQVPLKKIDLIVKACTELKAPLTVIGNGPEHGRLVDLAGPTVNFQTAMSDQDLPEALASAQAFIFASHEDFGIAPVEAMAAGTPVIAYKAGGALDYVKPGVTGMFFGEQDVKSIKKAIRTFDQKRYDARKIGLSTSLFDTKTFRKNITEFVEKTINN
ncbi:glycosyltransferase family 4 protein [soil metagenome]